MTVTLTFMPGKEPVALQWEVSYPSPQLGIEDGDMAIGAAAKKAGKALTCQGRPQDAGTYVYRCVLVGGPERLSNGSVAVVSFRVRATARPGPTTVRLSNVLGRVGGRQADHDRFESSGRGDSIRYEFEIPHIRLS